MTKFEDQLLEQLMTEHGDELRAMPAPAPARRRVRRPVWLATGALFSAQATFRSNGAGEVDLASAPASGKGFYAGVDPMGLIDAMQPASGGTAGYRWKGTQPQRFDVTVSEGTSRVASGGFTRRGAAPGVTVLSSSAMAVSGSHP